MDAAAALWQQWQAERTPALRQALVLQYLPLVHYVVDRIAVGMPSLMDKEDYMSEGTVGLIEAVDRYDPANGCPFQHYAAVRIRGAVLDALRRLNGRGCVRYRTLPLDGILGTDANGETYTAADLLADPNAVDPQAELERRELWQAVRALPARQGTVVGLYYRERLCLREIGALFGVSESGAFYLRRTAVQRLARAYR